MTATIMPSTAATALAPAIANAAGGKAQDAGAAAQPFGSLMAVQVATTSADGKAVMSGVVAAPVACMPATATMAGKLLPRTGRGGDGARPAIVDPVITATTERQVEPALDRLADEPAAPALTQEVTPEMPIETSTNPLPATPLPVPGATTPIAGEIVKLPERGEIVAEDEGADAPHPSRSRPEPDSKLAQPLPDPSALAVQPPQQIVPPVAAHLPRQQTVSTEPGEDPVAQPLRRTFEGVASTRAPAAVGESTPVVPSTAADLAPPSPLPVAAPMHSENGPVGMSFGQALLPVTARDSSQIYGGTLTPTATHEQPVVSAQAGQMGQAMGVAIARGVDAGRDTLLVRLDPAEMGRIHVRLSFDHDGAVRVAMSADSPVALDLLRREAGDLGRALSDAGVRADSQSFRFDGGGSQGQGFAQQGSRNGENGQPQGGQFSLDGAHLSEADIPPTPSGAYRGLRSAGGLNLII